MLELSPVAASAATVKATVCNGVLPAGTYKNVDALAGCTINNMSISGNLKVEPKGTLTMNGPGTVIGGNLTSKNASWLSLHGNTYATFGIEIKGNLVVRGTLSQPGKSIEPISGHNSFCDTQVDGKTKIVDNTRKAGFAIGAYECGAGNNFVKGLKLTGNNGGLFVGSFNIVNPLNSSFANIASRILIYGNKHGKWIRHNSITGNCRLYGNTPPIAGRGNVAGGTNTCNRKA